MHLHLVHFFLWLCDCLCECVPRTWKCPQRPQDVMEQQAVDGQAIVRGLMWVMGMESSLSGRTVRLLTTEPPPQSPTLPFFCFVLLCFVFFKVDHLCCFGIVCKHRTNTISPCVLFLVAHFPSEMLLYLYQFASLWTWKMKGIIHINWDP